MSDETEITDQVEGDVAADAEGDVEEAEAPRRRRGMTPLGIAIAAVAGILIAGIAILVLALVGTGGGDTHQAAVPPAVDQSPPVQVAPSGSMTVDHDVVDLGDVPLGQMVTAEWTITNSGDTPLLIQKVGPTRVVQGCCPSQAAIDSTDLAPGASTTVKLEFMMHEGMGGPHLFEIPVYTSDPAHTEYTLQVKGNFV